MAEPRTAHHPLLLPAIAASQFAPPFMISGVAVALPSLGAELGAGATALSLVVTLFLAASLALLLPFGRLGDAGDKAALYKLGMAAFALSSIAVGLVSSIWLVLVLRFVQGAFSASVQANGTALVADVVPPERRGRAFGILIGSVYAGLTFGPIVAGFLVDWWGWRAVFLAGGGVLLAAVVPIQLMLPGRWRPGSLRAVHLPSAALAVTAILVLVGGASSLREGAAGWIAGAAGLVLIGLFVFSQRGLEQPLLNVEVLGRNAVLRNALVVQWLLYCNAFGTVFLLSLYMQTVLGGSAKLAGEVIAFGTLLMAVLAPFAGRLADRVSPAAIATGGVAVALGAALLATLLGAGSTFFAVGAVLAVQGVGFAFFSTPNMTIVMNAVPAHRTGIASALSAAARMLGMVSGMLIVAAIISLEIGHDPIGADPAKLVATMKISFWLLAAVTALALLLSARRSR